MAWVKIFVSRPAVSPNHLDCFAKGPSASRACAQRLIKIPEGLAYHRVTRHLPLDLAIQASEGLG